ncbi:MAG: excinuclease ABC subunit C [Bacteroidetes bacterium HGW-Bacteroidetes-15]|nr:MAG: excinuclease ABC subunit C [Bacteroidetes bacterium HGW-Bacteroidetes-15]
MAYTYIIYSAQLDKYYIGSTRVELSERIQKHNTNHKGFTGRANDWSLKYSEYFDMYELAGKREREIKGWKSRKLIEKLCSN